MIFSLFSSSSFTWATRADSSTGDWSKRGREEGDRDEERERKWKMKWVGQFVGLDLNKLHSMHMWTHSSQFQTSSTMLQCPEWGHYMSYTDDGFPQTLTYMYMYIIYTEYGSMHNISVTHSQLWWDSSHHLWLTDLPLWPLLHLWLHFMAHMLKERWIIIHHGHSLVEHAVSEIWTCHITHLNYTCAKVQKFKKTMKKIFYLGAPYFRFRNKVCNMEIKWAHTCKCTCACIYTAHL